MRDLVEIALEAAAAAGESVMSNYENHLLVDKKLDGSPVTVADIEAHQTIKEILAPSDLVIVSEEEKEADQATERYWLVDPLDGTKDFLAGNGEFTVNIALIEQGGPILGVVLAPAKSDIFWGLRGSGAWRIQQGKPERLAQAQASRKLTMVFSKSENAEELEGFMRMNGIANSTSVGSALKYGLLAAAECDVFPRLVGSSEWDTAAGQAVLEASGGAVVEWDTGTPLSYGKPLRRNPRLLSFRSPYEVANFSRREFRTGIS